MVENEQGCQLDDECDRCSACFFGWARPRDSGECHYCPPACPQFNATSNFGMPAFRLLPTCSDWLENYAAVDWPADPKVRETVLNRVVHDGWLVWDEHNPSDLEEDE